MSGTNNDAELIRLTNELTKDFARWDSLFRNGGSDPFWTDGVNLNLVRNHILSDKQAIERIVAAEQEELSFFGMSYPDIYYRATPDKVPPEYMVKAKAIRQWAQEQLALYESDPNFLYILENHSKVFSKGETKATKDAGLSIWTTCGLTRYRSAIVKDDLVAMRRDFHEPYEAKAKRWAEGARSLKAFLEAEHSPEDDIPIPDEYANEEYLEGNTEDVSVVPDTEEELPTSPEKPSLDSMISGAKARTNSDKIENKSREQQMSLF